MLSLLPLLAALALPPLNAEEQQTLKNGAARADAFADCAGVWDYFSLLAREDGKPASAEHLKNLGNGAQTAALWLHANINTVNGGPRAPYGAWLPMVKPRREATTLRLLSAAELGDQQTAPAMVKECQAMLDSQEYAIDKIRKDSVEQQIGK